MIQTILADLRSSVDSTRLSGFSYWARVIGRSLLSPAAHVVVMYRISTVLYRNPLTRPFAFLLRTISIVYTGSEIHPAAVIGPGLTLVHCQQVMIGQGVVIGSNARICHNVSIGGDAGSTEFAGCPKIGDYVQIGMAALIMGPVTVGDWSQIGAQSLVIKDVPARAIVAGSPARVLRMVDDVPVGPIC